MIEDVLRKKLAKALSEREALASFYYHFTDPVRPWDELSGYERRDILERARRAVEGEPAAKGYSLYEELV
jgi:hypothetical protein